MTASRFTAALMTAVLASLLVGACTETELKEIPPPKPEEQAPARSANKLRIHWNGTTTSLEMDPDQGRRLELMLSDFVAQATSEQRLQVDAEIMRKFYAGSHSVELILPRPKSLLVGFSGEKATVTRLFVMLAGELVSPEGDGVAVIHSYPDYETGPLVVPRGRAELLRILGVDKDGRSLNSN